MTVVIIAILVVMEALLLNTLLRERKKFQAQLREATSGRGGSQAAEREALRLGRILAAMPDGVMVVEGYEVVYANPAIGQLLGGDPARILPTARASAEPSFLFTVHHPVYREVRCTRTVFEGESLLIVVRDVTDARRLDRMRIDFVANASHELKTPVAAILATTETLRSAIEDDPEAAKRFVATLGSESTRLSELVTDLLDLARLDQAAGVEAENCDASEIVRRVADSPPREAAVSITVQADDPAPTRVRAEDLSLAVRNLMDNAIRHTPPGGSIHLSVQTTGSEVRIVVSDTGEGIPAKDLPRIFERFYRVDPARGRDTGGTGLGLAIVRHVAESAGGNVSADSTYGEGSTFTLSLPAAHSDR